MKRIIAVVVCVAVSLAAIAGVVVLAASDGPTAARIGDTEVSQQYVDDELRVIGENERLQAAVEAAQAPALSNAEGSVTADVGSGWLSLIISQERAANEVERRGLPVTATDRDRARELAAQAIGGSRIYRSIPQWFRDRLVARWTPVAVLEREVTEHPPPALVDQLDAQCPSGRYISHILVESQAEAIAIQEQLDAGADFAELAERNSVDTDSARQGGQLGCIDGQQFVEPFATIAATQPIGVVSDPVTTQFGTHLVLVSDEPPAGLIEQLALDEVLRRTRGALVHVDPRYGTWNPVNGEVVPAAPTLAPTG